MGVAVTGWGHFIPEHRVTNAELAVRFGITEEWILSRTGIEERRYFNEGATSDMIVRAAKVCLLQAGIASSEVDCIIVATMTPDYLCPSTAAVVQNKIGADNAYGFDLMAACSGYLYAMQVAAALINSGTHKTVLVCAADKFSSIIDPQDRKTVLVFADGAGVCLLQQSDTLNHVGRSICRLDGSRHQDILMAAGGSQCPATALLVAEGSHFLRFRSKSISTDAVSLLSQVIREFLDKNDLSFDDVDYVVPHQANKRMIEALAAEFGLPIEKFIINIERVGNTSAATIPIAISQALENGQLRGNEKLLLASVGAGYTYAASLLDLTDTSTHHYDKSTHPAS